MKPYEREFFIARICAGYLKYKSKAGYDLHIHAPNAVENYESQIVYQEAYNLAIISNVFTQEEISEILVEKGLWGRKKESTLQDVQNDIEKLKVGIFKADAIRKKMQTALRQTLRKAEKKLTELIQEKHVYSFVTCEGYANSEQLKHLIELTTRYKDGSPYDWKDHDPMDLVHFYQQEQLSDKSLRGIAKSPEWRHIWSCSKQEEGIFGKGGCELSSEQKTLISYSLMYDSVYESMECPSDNIIEDDDALDGWFIVQRRNREKEMQESKAESLVSDKMRNADEIFIMTDPINDPDGAKEIHNLNNPVAKGIIRSRIQQIEDEGEVKYSEFADIKRERQMDATRQFSKTRK